MNIANGQTTQSGMRLPEELAHIVLVCMATQEEKCRLRAHKDTIMWAGWSLDDKTIATACWDESSQTQRQANASMLLARLAGKTGLEPSCLMESASSLAAVGL